MAHRRSERPNQGRNGRGHQFERHGVPLTRPIRHVAAISMSLGVVGRRPTVFIAELISCTDRDAFVGREQRTPDPVMAARRARLVVQQTNDPPSAFCTGRSAWSESRAPAGQNPRPTADNGVVQGLGQRHEDLVRRPPNRTGASGAYGVQVGRIGMKHRCFSSR